MLPVPRPCLPSRAGAARTGAVLALVLVPSLAACGSPVTVEPGPLASATACAEVMLALPSQVAGQERRSTDSQSTAAWGDPPVVLRCGVEPAGPTTDPCEQHGGIDWTARPTDDGYVLFSTFGLDPAIDVLVAPGASPDQVSAPLDEVAPALVGLPVTAACS